MNGVFSYLQIVSRFVVYSRLWLSLHYYQLEIPSFHYLIIFIFYVHFYSPNLSLWGAFSSRSEAWC